MSENTTSTVETPAGKTIAKNGKKPAPAKKVERTPLQQSRIDLVKALRKTGSKGVTTAVGLQVLADKLKTDRLGVYHLVNGASGKAGSAPTCLVATGHAKVTQVEGTGLAVFLTPKGFKTEFAETPFAR